jgi:hypothetical protein
MLLTLTKQLILQFAEEILKLPYRCARNLSTLSFSTLLIHVISLPAREQVSLAVDMRIDRLAIPFSQIAII